MKREDICECDQANHPAADSYGVLIYKRVKSEVIEV